jgi:hypothetical protein
MRQKFRATKFKPDSQLRIEQCNDIIDQYLAQGLRLTLRQLYYQLVTKNIIKNEERSYKNLSGLVSDGRLAGLIDWDAIEDRVRAPKMASEFSNLGELVDAALASYRLPRWAGQENYVELWVEKDALAGVLWPIAREYHVTLMVNRGYSSQSAMYESSRRFIDRTEIDENGDAKNPIILYLGDHDPSGEDMVRDVSDRLLMFNIGVDVRKIALTISQVQAYSLPPNPTKVTDSRAADYIKKFGHECWEVDALPPNVLSKLIRDELKQVVDMKRMKAVIAREEEDKTALKEAVQELGR